MAERALELLEQLYELYGRLEVEIAEAVRWMHQEGVDSLFLGIRRHSELTRRILAIGFSYLDEAFF